MKKLLDYATAFIRKMTVCDIVALKVCTTALGVILGLAVKKKDKRNVGFVAAVLLVVAYVPLMAHFAKSIADELKRDRRERLYYDDINGIDVTI